MPEEQMLSMERTKENNKFILDENSPTFIEKERVQKINILADGNCYYSCLSQSIDLTQENHLYYRNLIYDYIEKNRDYLMRFFQKEENELDNEYQMRYNNFKENIKQEDTYAGDFEISASSIILNRKIIVYNRVLLGYQFLNEYKQNQNIKETIHIAYINNNHFNLLENKNNENQSKEFTLSEIEKLHKKLEKYSNKIDLNTIETKQFKQVFNKKYVNYNRKECPDLYNEIYNYLSKDQLMRQLKSKIIHT